MSKSTQARSAIELFCTILIENRIFNVRAETLRQAKFNNFEATKQLWQLLFNVVQFCNGKSDDLDKQAASLHEDLDPENQVIFVKTELQKWGYMNQSLAKLSPEMVDGSRQLLLALGWVVHEQKVFDRIILGRSKPLHQSLMTLLGDKKGIVISESEESSLCKQRGQPSSTVEDLDKQVMLCGKLRLCLRRLHSVVLQRASLCQTICQSTKGVSLQPELNCLTPFEVYILRHRESLKKMVQRLESESQELKHLLDWKEKENIFWDWMESVLALDMDVQESGDGSLEQNHEVEEVFLPVPDSIGQDIWVARTNLRDDILKHEADIDRMEELLMGKKLSQVEVEIAVHNMEREITQLSRRLECCRQGHVTLPDHINSRDSLENLIQSSHPDGGGNQGFPGVRQSVQAVKASKESSLSQAVNTEIAALQKKVSALELDFKRLQVEHLQKLQKKIAEDTNFICIQPRTFKQFYR